MKITVIDSLKLLSDEEGTAYILYNIFDCIELAYHQVFNYKFNDLIKSTFQTSLISYIFVVVSLACEEGKKEGKMASSTKKIIVENQCTRLK